MVKSNLVLVVMAAGMGSRFKGLKQIQSVDEDGHVLMDYAIYDAIEAGFSEVVFIIRQDFEDKFKKIIGNRIEQKIPVTYVYQSLDDVPGNVELPDGRVKPWGTTHALWSARKALKGKKFLTINADDFYGRGAYTAAFDFLSNAKSESSHACICYDLIKTLSPTGTVSRGICQTDSEGNLSRIDERKNIKLEDGRGYYTVDSGVSYHLIPNGALASMNLWAFSEGFIDDIEVSFKQRFEEGIKTSPDTFEETISDAVQSILEREKGTVKCIPTDEQWFGMTYVEELSMVKNRLKELREDGVYVRDKW
ncbi:Nucleotidyl transferase [Lachnospiraceae bacterium]|nr:Nucleotidyl transferase [Lachnospiraceae bacterium]